MRIELALVLVLVACSEPIPVAGPRGAAGPSGAPGLAGASGLAGPRGEVGPMGLAGPDVLPRSGARLRAVVLRGDDGSALAGGWFDAQLGEPCRVLPTKDGSTQCLPGATFDAPPVPVSEAHTAAVAEVLNDLQGLRLFGDDGCSLDVDLFTGSGRFVVRAGEVWELGDVVGPVYARELVDDSIEGEAPMHEIMCRYRGQGRPLAHVSTETFVRFTPAP